MIANTLQFVLRHEETKDISVIVLTGAAEVLDDLDSQNEDTHERPYDEQRESSRKTIRDMREEWQVIPDMFIDNPIDPGVVIAKVKELIGT
jgi:hypothetical protein